MRTCRHLAFVVTTLLLGALSGCGNDPAAAPAEADAGVDASQDGDLDDSSVYPGRDASADADTEEQPQEGGPDSGEDADVVAQPYLLLVFDKDWVRTRVEGDEVQVGCIYADAEGLKLPDPGDLVIAAPEPSAILGADGEYSFADAGAYPFSCESESLSLATQRPLIVAYEGLDYRYVEAAQVMSALPDKLHAIVDANAAGDEGYYGAAVDDLEVLGGRIPALEQVALLIENPHGWPTEAQITGAALGPGADDSLWLSRLSELRQAVVAEQTALSGVTNPASDEQLQALKLAYGSTRQRLAAFASVEPSTLVVFKSLPQVGGLLREMVVTSRARFATLSTLFRADPPVPAPMPNEQGAMQPRFALVGTLAAIAEEETVGAYTYKSILKDVGRVVVEAMLSLKSNGLVTDDLPSGAQAPSITSVQGPSAGTVAAGSGFQLVGAFNTSPPKMRVVFIPPTLANEQGIIIELISGIDAVTQEGNVLKLNNSGRRLMDNLVSMYGAASSAGVQAIVLTPSSGSQTLLQFPALPLGINCSASTQGGTMIPIDYDYGRGTSAAVNVTAEPAGNCP